MFCVLQENFSRQIFELASGYSFYLCSEWIENDLHGHTGPRIDGILNDFIPRSR